MAWIALQPTTGAAAGLTARARQGLAFAVPAALCSRRFEEAQAMGMVRGTVLALNRRRRMAVVATDEGACSVIGGFGDDDGPEFNDVLCGPLDTPGSQFLYNETRCAWFNAFLRVCGCSFQDAVRETG